jgi:O-antigen/teichoic acid export membrane protein
VIALSLRRADAFEWSVGVLIASAAAAALAIGSVHRTIGPMRFSPELAIRRSLEGLGFSFAGSTQAIYDDIDKTILVHYGLNAENGFYTLAYRIVEFATTPIVAIDTAILPRHFVLGRSGISATTIKLVLKSLGAAAAAGTVAAGAILLFAPLIPRIVGRDFSGTLLALRWLCWIPLLRGVHRLTGVALTGSGNQRARTTAQFFVAIVNIVLNLWLIPIYGWVAAAWLSVASDGLLAVLNSSLLAWLWKTAPRRDMALTSAGMAQ